MVDGGVPSQGCVIVASSEQYPVPVGATVGFAFTVYVGATVARFPIVCSRLHVYPQ